MKVVNTRTNILYIHGFHTRTNHNEMPVVTHVFHTLETFIVKKTSSIKSKVQMPKVLEKIYTRLHEDMQQVQLGSMLRLRNVIFLYSLPFLFLTFHHPIVPFPYIYLGFTLLFSTLFILVL